MSLFCKNLWSVSGFNYWGLRSWRERSAPVRTAEQSTGSVSPAWLDIHFPIHFSCHKPPSKMSTTYSQNSSIYNKLHIKLCATSFLDDNLLHYIYFMHIRGQKLSKTPSSAFTNSWYVMHRRVWALWNPILVNDHAVYLPRSQGEHCDLFLKDRKDAYVFPFTVNLQSNDMM